jgi:hypothetical protein
LTLNLAAENLIGFLVSVIWKDLFSYEMDEQLVLIIAVGPWILEQRTYNWELGFRICYRVPNS